MSIAVSTTESESTTARLGDLAEFTPLGRLAEFTPEERVVTAIAGARACRSLLSDPATSGALTPAQMVEVCGRAIGEALDDHRKAAAFAPEVVP